MNSTLPEPKQSRTMMRIGISSCAMPGMPESTAIETRSSMPVLTMMPVTAMTLLSLEDVNCPAIAI